MPFQIYSNGFCPYCGMARDLLDRLGHEYDEIRIDLEPKQREVMEERSGRTSVPQIFLGDTHIGGYDELAALHRSGRLAELLAQEGADRE
ncbi:glutaredoxin 3 [Thioalkalivibrio sp.]|uniref:glutaredoxin 3 n=1 Tax=Thioalkalivibrio sp. TaxID=2093813 RepID=UPI003975F0FF